MNRSRLLLAVASVLAGTAVALGVLGFVYNPLLVIFALPFGAASYFLWADATGRVRMRWARAGFRDRTDERDADRGPPGARSRRARRARATGFDGSRGVDRARPGMDRTEALRVLGLDSEPDEATIRKAYRERVKEVHPDAENGDEEAFKRVTAAYDRLLG